MKLKEFLKEKGAKGDVEKLVKEGFVLLNKQKVKNPDLPVGSDDDITILGKSLKDMPGSFWTIKGIQDELNFISPGDLVVDVESPDPGFPKFLEGFGTRVVVVTKGNPLLLDYEGKVVQENIMSLKDTRKITREKADIIISELGLDPISCFQALSNILPALKKDGKILMFLSMRKRNKEELKEIAKRFFDDMGLEMKKTYTYKNGVYIYARRLGY